MSDTKKMSNVLFSVFPSENFVDLELYQYGREFCHPAHSFGPAARNHYLFHYVFSGTGTLNANDSKGVTKSYQIKSGQGFMLFPGQISTYIADSTLPWDYAWIEFDGLRAKEVVDVAGLSMDRPVYRARSHDLREVMANEMVYITEHASESALHLIGHLYLFVDALSRSSATMKISRGSKLRDFYVHEALVFIEHNFQNDISVEDIAANCGLNRSYFGKIFKAAVGKSPQDFLLQYRMIRASELLKLTTLSISDIGEAVGYPDQFHFSRAFKNIHGVSPREWRNKNRVADPATPLRDKPAAEN